MRKITDGFIRRGIKKHWSSLHFSENLKISEEDFWSLLESSFNNKRQTEWYIREIKKNQQNTKTQGTQGTLTTQGTQTSQATQTTQGTTIMPPVEEVVQESTEVIQESTVVQEISELEDKINELVSQKNSYFSALSSEKVFLKQTLRALDECSHRIEVLKTDIQTTTNTLKSYNNLLAEKKSMLEKLRRVEVFVFSDGIQGIEVSDELDTTLYAEMISSIEAEGLTVREIKAIAKLITYIRNNHNNYDILFENALSQKLFEKNIS